MFVRTSCLLWRIVCGPWFKLSSRCWWTYFIARSCSSLKTQMPDGNVRVEASSLSEFYFPINKTVLTVFLFLYVIFLSRAALCNGAVLLSVLHLSSCCERLFSVCQSYKRDYLCVCAAICVCLRVTASMGIILRCRIS